MALRSGRNPSMQLEALRLFSLLDSRSSSANLIGDTERVNAFVSDLASGLNSSLANPSRLHGWRVQALFEAMIVGLGEVKLIKEEDVGTYFFSDGDGNVKVPDFRLIRGDGQRLLVEVKTVDPKQPDRPHRIREADVDAWLRYADLTGARLLLAHYWSAWNLWTLADPTVFRRQEGKLIVDLETAMRASELGLLGDAMIATVPPLVFSLIADLSVPQNASPNETVGTTDLVFTIGEVEMSAGGKALTDDTERNIAWFLIQFGRWQLNKEAIIDGAMIRRVDLVLTPQEKVAGQGFDMVGQLSSMYSAMYNLSTLTEGGEIQGLRHDVSPGMLGSLIPRDYFDRADRTLPLWKFVQHPSLGPEAT